VLIRCDGIGRFPGLSLDKIVVRSSTDNTKYTFLGPRRVEAPKFEVLIEASVAASVGYIISVLPASNEWDDASWMRDVTVNLLGLDGESGACSLQKLPSLPSAAGGRKVYTYRCSSPIDVGEILLVRFVLKVDDAKFSPMFDMRRAIITNIATSQRWILSVPFALGSATPSIECPLETRITYRLTISTSGTFASACDHNVFIRMTGDAGDSGELQLTLPRSGRRPFQQGSNDEFDVLVPQLLGNLKLLRIGHDNSGSAPGWGLEAVQVLDVESLETWQFRIGSFIEYVFIGNDLNCVYEVYNLSFLQVSVHFC
jgi:hypothetical protein